MFGRALVSSIAILAGVYVVSGFSRTLVASSFTRTVPGEGLPARAPVEGARAFPASARSQSERATARLAEAPEARRRQASVIGAALRAQEQERVKTVADGVYTETQAARGASVYDTACAGCHRADLGGATGPSLKAQRFAREFAGKDLKTLFTKVATTMPRNAPASLGDNVNLDIVAYVLKENGFPAGPRELTADALDGVRVLPGRPKPAPPIGDFSYVEVVGCLAAGPQHTWMLTHASAPVVPAASASAASTPSAAKPLGDETFQLVDAMAYAPDDHAGHKVYVRGLLIRLPGEQRMTISAFEMVSPTCSE